MVARLVNGSPRNFPTKPTLPQISNLTYPSDLFSHAGNNVDSAFYTHIIPGDYRTNTPISSGIMALPLPRKINDIQVLTWSQESLTAIAAQLGAGILINPVNIAGAATGVAINPYLFMQFKHPNFKPIEMTWTLVANNEEESVNIARIIDTFKFHSSPQINGPVMVYPSLFNIKLNPEPRFTFRIKPSIVEAVAADYTAGDLPAFYKNGAPVVVNLTVRFKETQIWTKNDPAYDNVENQNAGG